MRNETVENGNKGTDALQQLVEQECLLAQVDLDGTTAIGLSDDGRRICLRHRGQEYNGQLERPLVHQIGGRLWSELKEFDRVWTFWQSSFKNNKAALEADIAALFGRSDLRLRYFNTPSRGNPIYGIVSPQFVEVNQLEFRATFMEQVQSHSLLRPASTGVESNRFGDAIEHFQFDSPGFQVNYRYGLVYARNNGYDAYKVNWERYVLVCSNGLRVWEGSKYRWSHTREVDLHDFITNTVQEGLENQQHIEQCIGAARERELHREDLSELYARLSLAAASKQRIQAKLAEDVRLVGNNEWALSQAMTWLGTHEKAIPIRFKNRLTGLGTDVLEQSLEAVLQRRVEPGKDGYYGLVLPPERLH